MGANFIPNSDSTYTAGSIQYFVHSTDTKWYSVNINDPTNLVELPNIIQMDTESVCSNTLVVISNKKNNSSYNSTFYVDTKKLIDNNARQNDQANIYYAAAKVHLGNTANGLLPLTVKLDVQGKCYIGLFVKKSDIEIIGGINPTLLVYDIVKYYLYKVHVYVKRYDKIIQQTLESVASNVFEVVSSIEFGTYDKIYEMPNNDFFAIKNKQLMYFKKTEKANNIDNA